MSLKTRLYHFWFLLSRPMTLGVRLVACDDQGRVLLVKHTYVSGWHFPGGGVDNGENCYDAAVRETLEETGLSPVGALKTFGIYFNIGTSKRDHVVVYTCDGVTGTLNPQAEEIAEAQFFALDQLPVDTAEATRSRLDEIFGGAPISPIW